MNNKTLINVGATTLLTLGALGITFASDEVKNDELKNINEINNKIVKEAVKGITWESKDEVEFKDTLSTIERKLEEERLRKLEEKRKQEEIARKKAEEEAKNNLGTFNVSFYTAQCYQCSGITKSGVDIRNNIKYQGYGIVASSWSQIPAYSIIEIENLGQYIVLDTGGRITTGHLDVLVSSKQEAYRLGRQYLNVKVIRWGEGE